LVRKWIVLELQLYQLDYNFYHESEQHPVVPLPAEERDNLETHGSDNEDDNSEEEVFVTLILAVCSDDPNSLRERPT